MNSNESNIFKFCFLRIVERIMNIGVNPYILGSTSFGSKKFSSSI